MARTGAGAPTARFYQVSESLESALGKVALKAYERGLRVCVVASGVEQARQLDELLWARPVGEFLPHRLWNGPEPERQPLLIALEPEDRNGATVAIAAHGRVLDEAGRFDLIIDFADGMNPEGLQGSRERFRRYRDQGCAMEYWEQGPDGWKKKV